MEQMGNREGASEYAKMLKKKKKQLKDMTANSATLSSSASAAAARAANEFNKTNAERQVMQQAFAAAPPGSDKLAEMQRAYEEVAAPPPSAGADTPDSRTCSFCSKGSASRLKVCGACMKVYYCDAACQKAAWNGHKKVCKGKKKGKNPTLPLTWDQLEDGQGDVMEGKTLEVRVLVDASVIRQVWECKDRVGAVRRVAAYTASGKIAGMAVGKVMTWKSPKAHWFGDGSSGARLEDGDMRNVTVA